MLEAPTFTPAEESVRHIIAEDGIHLVHFWAPWCRNSIDELAAGWAALVDRHPEVSFTFVTIWNDGASGRGTMHDHGLPDRVVEITQADYGPSDDKTLRRRSFLGLPVTWIPSTWIFHRNGQLAFALNFGEMDPNTVGALIEAAGRAW